MKPRPKILVSACLLGRSVRYDGGHKAQAWLLDVLAKSAELVPLCPETEAGFGIPRPPMQLSGDADAPRLLLVDDPTQDLTQPMLDWIERFLAHLGPVDATILKARSPSCGRSVPLFSLQGEPLEQLTQGLFAGALRAVQPGLLILDEEDMAREAEQQRLLRHLGLLSL